MMYLILPSSTALITSWLVPRKLLWPSSIINSLLISATSINLMVNHSSSTWHSLFTNFAADNMAAPLMILSTWLAPMSLMASMKTMQKFNHIKQRAFMSTIFMILISLILTFSSLELTLFYIAFETTLLPTLTLIARWGAQKERYQASVYFLFYTLIGSLPLLMAMMAMFNLTKTLTFPLIYLSMKMTSLPITMTSMWWTFCLIAFVMKMPIYGFHLWLPKAHVEAPMAGSMMLAAILLKLGGYGLLRTMPVFLSPSSFLLSKPLTTFCMWGALITSMMCLRQTDLKALMAYSSVGHMSMVASGVFSLSLWGTSGALTLMIAHGLISSALFCLAKLLYERKGTRTLSITRGFKLITPLLTIWWMITCVSNLGLPPTPNLMGELLVLVAMMDWNTLSTPIITIATMFGAIYSLLIFSKTNKSTFPQFLNNVTPISTSEHTLMTLHLAPLIFLMVKPSSILMW